MSTRLPDTAGSIAFQVLAEIAVGSTTRVDLSRSADGRLLAVKRLLPHVAEDPGFANMFLDEVWMTAALKHPNVLEVAGWGNDAHGTYLAFELVQGVSLARLMKTVFETGEVFTERMVVFVASRLCRGLAAAHALCSPEGEHLNLVHRDLTPYNVLVGFDGDVKIADFGLAKAKQRLTKTLTGLLKGSPQYMAPEQARGDRDIDGRADLFSLGVMLFELFTGRRPWQASSELEMATFTATDPPQDMRELRPKIDKELVAIVMGCLERDRTRRFQRASDIGERLENWLTVHGYQEGNEEALARFVRRNAMRQMRWFERAVGGDLAGPPESMRPAPPKPEPPRVPSYTNASNAPLPSQQGGGVVPAQVRRPQPAPRPTSNRPQDPAAFPKRYPAVPAVAAPRTSDPAARARITVARPALPPPVADAEVTDVSPHPMAPPAEGDGEWGEEVPTLVQKQARRRALKARETAQPQPRALQPLIADDDSDQRGTTVKREAARLAGAPRAPVDPGERRAPVDELESQELPTMPITTGERRAALMAPAPTTQVLDTRQLPGVVAAPGPGVPPPPMRGRASSPALAPGSMPPPPQRGSVPPPPRGSVPPPPGRTSTPPAMLAPPSRASAPPGMLAPPMRVESPPSGVRAALSAFDPQRVAAEAERLVAFAVHANEDAKNAATVAVQRAQLAKVANDAARIAAEARRALERGDGAQAAQRLAEALALEEAVRRGDVAPASGPAPIPTEPLVGRGSVPPPMMAGPGMTTRMNGSSPYTDTGGFGPPAHAMAPLGVPAPPPGGVDPTQSAMNVEVFRDRLQPTIFGIPQVIAIALAVGFVAALVVILYFIF